MATLVVAHGAWGGGWGWKKIRPLLEARGHDLYTPTYTGLGERTHLAHPAIDLETHIRDILAVLEYEDLRGVTLVGHSYGGMVATGVADRAGDRVQRVIYLDAYVPEDGRRLLDYTTPAYRESLLARVRDDPDGWRISPNAPAPDTSEADVAWSLPRRSMQPIRTFAQEIRLTGAIERLPRAYVYCRRARPDDVFRQFLERARAKGWPTFEIDASHNAQITAPEALAELLDELVRPAASG